MPVSIVPPKPEPTSKPWRRAATCRPWPAPLELVEDRRPEPRGHVAHHALHHAAHGVALADLVHARDHLLRDLRVRAAHDVVLDLLRCHGVVVHLGLDLLYLLHVAEHLHARVGAQDLLRNGTRRHAADGLPRRGPAAARHGAHAVLGVVGRVRVRGAVLERHLVVVVGPLVLVAHQQRDRRAQRHAVHHPRQDLHLVVLLPRRRQAALPRPPPRQLLLDLRRGNGQPRGHAVHDHAHAAPVALPPRRYPEQAPPGVAHAHAHRGAGVPSPARRERRRCESASGVGARGYQQQHSSHRRQHPGCVE